MTLLRLLGFATLLLSTGCSFFLGPSRSEPEALAIERTPERIARGEYLANAVAGCVHCHSRREMSRFAMPLQPGSHGGGGDCFGEEMGLPGKICGANITSSRTAGLGEWTDGEILRAMREGISRDGSALFPMMPYGDYRHMDDEDAYSVIAYLRTLPAIDTPAPPSEYNFIITGVINSFPSPVEGPVRAPSREDTVAYGKYLASLSGCAHCHTPRSGLGFDEDRWMAGGVETKSPGVLHVVSANITPHESGIGRYSREQFISLFKAYEDAEAVAVEVPPENRTLMPWTDYAKMTEEDLGAIYDYLRTVKPIDNKVERWPSAAKAAATKG